MKKIGIVGIDRSGSDANKPYVVVSIFTENKSVYTKVYNEIRKLCSSYNPVLGYAKEIKAKEIGSKKLMQQIIKLVLERGLKFSVTVFKGSVKGIARGKEKGYVKTEASIWFKSLEKLIKREKLNPEQIIMDISFSGTKDQSLFDFLIQKSIEKTFGTKPWIKSLDSRFEDGIKIADLLAGFFRNSEIRKAYRKYVGTISEVDVKLKTIEPSYLTSIQWSNNIINSDIFKAFGFIGFITTYLDDLNYTSSLSTTDSVSYTNSPRYIDTPSTTDTTAVDNDSMPRCGKSVPRIREMDFGCNGNGKW